MMLYLIIILIVSYTIRAREILHENTFLFDNEQWKIIGNKIIEPAVHQSYNIDNQISHYIMFKDTLINVDHKNPNDKSIEDFLHLLE